MSPTERELLETTTRGVLQLQRWMIQMTRDVQTLLAAMATAATLSEADRANAQVTQDEVVKLVAKTQTLEETIQQMRDDAANGVVLTVEQFDDLLAKAQAVNAALGASKAVEDATRDAADANNDTPPPAP